MHIFTFWEGPKPPVIELCQQSLLKYNSNAIILDRNNLHSWIPLSSLPSWWSNPDIPWSRKTDWLRIEILYRHGGLWIDADIVVLKPLKSFISSIHDSVLFGATGRQCIPTEIHQWLVPSNWMIASQRQGQLITHARRLLQNYTHEQSVLNAEYHELGKHLLWKALQLCTSDYTYFHVNPKHCGIRDKDGFWVTTNRLVSGERVRFMGSDDDLIVAVWYLSELPTKFRHWRSSQWLKGHTELGRIMARALSSK